VIEVIFFLNTQFQRPGIQKKSPQIRKTLLVMSRRLRNHAGVVSNSTPQGKGEFDALIYIPLLQSLLDFFQFAIC
jgi:hypothetical protein